MIPTVQKPVRKIAVQQDDFATWTNKELVPFLQQVRTALNYINRQQATFQTAGTATMTTIWSSQDIAVGTVVRFDANVIGVDLAGDRSAWLRIATFYNDGTLNAEGAQVNLYAQNASGMNLRFFIVNNHVDLQVQDIGDTTNWTAIIDAQVAS